LRLSGLTGTKIKTKLVESYYSFWLSVTTRGKGYFAEKPAYIVDLNAGTGLVEIEETGEIVYGSAGHALDRKYGPKRELNKKLRIILVESMQDCRDALFDNIKKNWSEAEIHEYKPRWYRSSDECVDLFESAEDFLHYKKPSSLGNSLFYFDPLLAPDLDLIDQIASERIHKPFRINTEFLIFFFTSDWIVGRKNFTALPRTDDESSWTREMSKSADAADKAFGDRTWLEVMKSDHEIASLELKLIEFYKKSLRKWFRFVQPLPFIPKPGQRYDLFCCSNYDVGMNVINNFYKKLTWPFGLEAKNRTTYDKFVLEHPSKKMKGTARSAEWKCLWHIMKNHTDGVCDSNCRGDIMDQVSSRAHLRSTLQWLHDEGYIKPVEPERWMWPKSARFPMYIVDWEFVQKKLNVNPPKSPEPLKPEDLHKPRILKSESNDNESEEEQPTLDTFFD